MGGDREDEGWPKVGRSCQSQRSHLRCGRDGNQERPENSGGLVSTQQEMVSPALQPQHSVRLDISHSYRQTSQTSQIIHINPGQSNLISISMSYLAAIIIDL